MSIENRSHLKKDPFTYLNFDVLSIISSGLSLEDLRNLSMVSQKAHAIAKYEFTKRHLDQVNGVTAFFISGAQKMLVKRAIRVKSSSKSLYDLTPKHLKEIERQRDEYIKKVRTFSEQRFFGLRSFLGYKTDMCFNLSLDVHKRFSLNLEETPELFRKYFYQEAGFTKEVAQFFLTLDPNIFSLFSRDLQGNREVATLACSLQRGNLALAKAPFSEDLDSISKLIQSDQIAPWPEHPKFFYHSMLHFFSNEAKKCEEIVLELLRKNGPGNLYYADKSLKSSSNFLIKASQSSHAPILKYATSKIRSNAAFAREICESYPANLNHLHTSLLSRPEFAYRAVSYNPQNMKKVIGACAQTNRETLLLDENLAMIALRGDLSLLSFMLAFRSNKGFIFKVASEINPKIFPFVSADLQFDLSFCHELVDRHPENLTFMPNDLIISKLSQNGMLLSYLSEVQKQDTSYVCAAISSNPAAFQYAAMKFREAPIYVMGLSKKLRVPLLPYASSSFRRTNSNVVSLVNIEPINSSFTTKALYEYVFPKFTLAQVDRFFTFIVEGLKKDTELFHLLDESIKNDPITLLKIQEQNLGVNF